MLIPYTISIQQSILLYLPICSQRGPLQYSIHSHAAVPSPSSTHTPPLEQTLALHGSTEIIKYL
jgi:hypothetical protein